MTEVTNDPSVSHSSEGDPLGSSQGLPPEGANGAGNDARMNLLASIRAKREEAKGDHVLDIDIPGYEGMVVARFRPFPIEKTERKMAEFQKMVGKQPVMLKAACDTLIDACEQIMIRNGPEDEPKPIDADAVPPIAFDSRLAELFGYSATTARQVVLGLFPTEQAIVAMNIRVSGWMQDVSSDTDRELLGNS